MKDWKCEISQADDKKLERRLDRLAREGYEIFKITSVGEYRLLIIAHREMDLQRAAELYTEDKKKELEEMKKQRKKDEDQGWFEK